MVTLTLAYSPSVCLPAAELAACNWAVCVLKALGNEAETQPDHTSYGMLLTLVCVYILEHTLFKSLSGMTVSSVRSLFVFNKLSTSYTVIKTLQISTFLQLLTTYIRLLQ